MRVRNQLKITHVIKSVFSASLIVSYMRKVEWLIPFREWSLPKQFRRLPLASIKQRLRSINHLKLIGESNTHTFALRASASHTSCSLSRTERVMNRWARKREAGALKSKWQESNGWIWKVSRSERSSPTMRLIKCFPLCGPFARKWAVNLIISG